jgi:hypothetical protein
MYFVFFIVCPCETSTASWNMLILHDPLSRISPGAK